MTQVKEGDVIRVHYTGKLKDGTVFDSSRDGDPLKFQVGKGEVIAGFDQAMVGMAAGEVKTVEIPAEDAYGDYEENRKIEISREQVPPGLDLEVGQALQMNPRDGDPIIVTVAAMEAETITLDANHPLAGKDLVFEVELLEIS